MRELRKSESNGKLRRSGLPTRRRHAGAAQVSTAELAALQASLTELCGGIAIELAGRHLSCQSVHRQTCSALPGHPRGGRMRRPACRSAPPCQAAPPDLLLCLAYTPSAHNGCRVQCSWACRCATQLLCALSVKSARQLATLHARLLPRCSDPQTPRTRTPTHRIVHPPGKVGGGGCLWSGSVWDLPQGAAPACSRRARALDNMFTAAFVPELRIAGVHASMPRAPPEPQALPGSSAPLHTQPKTEHGPASHVPAR